MASSVLNTVEMLQEIVQKNILYGDFVLSSGQKSNFYIDLRCVTLDPEAAWIIGDLIYSYATYFNTKAVGGLELGAIPVVCAALAASRGRERQMTGFMVRKKNKDHGTQKLIEGPAISGKRVLIVEDVSTTGASAAEAISAARAADAEVVAVVSVLDREQGAVKLINSLSVAYYPLLKLSQLQLRAE